MRTSVIARISLTVEKIEHVLAYAPDLLEYHLACAEFKHEAFLWMEIYVDCLYCQVLRG